MSKHLNEIGRYIPAKQAAQMLGYSTTTLRTWAIQGKIPAILSPGGKYRYRVDIFLEAAAAASKDRLSREAKKLKAKQDAIAKKSEAARKAKLEKRKELAKAQKSKSPAVEMMPGEQPLPL